MTTDLSNKEEQITKLMSRIVKGPLQPIEEKQESLSEEILEISKEIDNISSIQSRVDRNLNNFTKSFEEKLEDVESNLNGALADQLRHLSKNLLDRIETEKGNLLDACDTKLAELNGRINQFDQDLSKSIASRYGEIHQKIADIEGNLKTLEERQEKNSTSQLDRLGALEAINNDLSAQLRDSSSTALSNLSESKDYLANRITDTGTSILSKADDLLQRTSDLSENLEEGKSSIVDVNSKQHEALIEELNKANKNVKYALYAIVAAVLVTTINLGFSLWQHTANL